MRRGCLLGEWEVGRSGGAEELQKLSSYLTRSSVQLNVARLKVALLAGFIIEELYSHRPQKLFTGDLVAALLSHFQYE